MKVLLTGASSFSGLWFAEMLHAAGHEVVAPLTQAPDAYAGLRAERVRRLGMVARIEGKCRFGDGRFLALCAEPFDALCHHAAVVANYRSLDFDVLGAVGETTRDVRAVLEALAAGGLKAVVATGSVFENDEGLGDEPRRAFSPYGLSKHIAGEVTAFWCEQAGVPFYKFLIANPFGPYEEARFCDYLLRCWRAGSVAEVRTPAYLRDNIHVDLMAMAYAEFVAQAAERRAPARFGPQGYLGTQGEFARRFACEIGRRLGLDTPVSLLPQTDFPEPLTRFNISRVDHSRYHWSDAAAWDRLAAYYDASR